MKLFPLRLTTLVLGSLFLLNGSVTPSSVLSFRELARPTGAAVVHPDVRWAVFLRKDLYFGAALLPFAGAGRCDRAVVRQRDRVRSCGWRVRRHVRGRFWQALGQRLQASVLFCFRSGRELFAECPFAPATSCVGWLG